jgi:hypothetical protein
MTGVFDAYLSKSKVPKKQPDDSAILRQMWNDPSWHCADDLASPSRRPGNP